MTYGQVAVTNSAGQVADETASEITRLVALVLTKVPLWIAAFIVIVLSVIAAKIIRKVVENKLAEKGIEEEHQELQILGGRLTYSGVLVLGVTVGLKIAGIDLTTIIAAVAFGIGFALKDLIMNFLAGIMILVGRHFSIGDFISIGSTIGKIVEIQSRVTVLQAIDGTKVIVPNAELFKKQVTSFTGNPFRRIEVKVGIDYRNNLENALRVTMEAAKHTKGVMVEPKPAVLIDSFGDNGVIIKVRAWVDSHGGWVKVKSELTKNIKKLFDEYGIRIPWPMFVNVDDKDMVLSETIFEDTHPQPAEPTVPEIQQQQPAQPVTAPQSTAVGETEEQPLRPLSENR